jgi:GTP pyrophosphokinase
MLNDVAMHDTLDTLTRIFTERGDEAGAALIRRACAFAEEAHREQKRLTGEPYLIHPLATAIKLAHMQLGAAVVAAGLLHDTIEDTVLPPQEVRDRMEREFGKDITSIVERVTKLGKLQYRGMERYVENLRKMFMAMATDARAIFVKFADRVHNLETLGVVPEAKRLRIAREALDLYAPIAGRLGMGQIRGELEDLSFKYVHPEEYAWVSSLVEGQLQTKQKYINEIIKIVEKDLATARIPVMNLSGRAKHLYSLYRKLQAHDRDISRIYDVIALRIQVPTVGDCYAALGVIHGRWKPLKGRIKDYIAQPKPNGYQSLHTTIFCEEGQIVEIQIRTPEMHQAAEFGIAAHWQYTEAGKLSKKPQTKELAWMEEFAHIQQEITDHKKFLENLELYKFDVFQNRIFVFTPTGDVIDLPEAATPVDFAYAIHTDIGDKCTAARVNNEMVSLDKPLKSGDMVEIVIDKNRKTPNQDWLKFVKTHSARDKIRARAKNSVADWIRKVVVERTEQKIRNKK